MRILLLAEFFPSLDNPIFSGGVENRCYYIAKYLSQNNSILVLSRRKTGEQQKESSGNLTVIRYGRSVNDTSATLISIFSRFSYLFKCIFLIREENFDMVEGTNFVTYLPAVIIGSIKNVPVVFFYADVLIGKWRKLFGSIVGGIGELSERLFLKLPCNGIITISQTVKNKLISYGIVEQKIDVIYCGVDGSWRKMENSEKKDQILVISRLVAYKRIDWAIELLKNLGNTYRNYNLVIIGDGPENNNLRQLAYKLGISNRVEFKSKLDQKEIEKYYTESKILVHPSLIEGFGIVLVEAAKFGTPFIAADIPTSKEIENNLGSGLLFKHNSFDSLVENTVAMLSDKHKYSILRENGLEKVYKFDWKALAKETENTYKKIVAGKKATK